MSMLIPGIMATVIASTIRGSIVGVLIGWRRHHVDFHLESSSFAALISCPAMIRYWISVVPS